MCEARLLCALRPQCPARPPPYQVSFVKRGEAAAQGVPEGHPVPGFSPPEAAPVAADFSHKWQHMVEAVHRQGLAAGGQVCGHRLCWQTSK